MASGHSLVMPPCARFILPALLLAGVALPACSDDTIVGDTMDSTSEDPTLDPTLDPTDNPTDPSGDGDGDEPGGPPCGGDIVGCDDTPTPFELDPECTLEGELEVVHGNGFEMFEALAGNQFPDREFGLQGGQHMWVGLQVRNPALDFTQLRVTIELDGCRYADVSCTDASHWSEYPTRVLVVDEDTIGVTEEGYFELLNILYILEGWDWTQPERWRWRVTVEDPCGRVGQVSVNAIPT